MSIQKTIAGLCLLLISHMASAETWTMMVMLDSPSVVGASLPSVTQSFITGTRDDCERIAISIIGQYQALLLRFHGENAVNGSRHAHSCLPVAASLPASPASVPSQSAPIIF